MYVYFLIVSTQSAASESRVINTVLAWSPERVTMPEKLIAALTPGICTPGQFFHSGRPFQVSFIVEFAQQWKEQEAGERDRLLTDPWEFKEFVMQVDLRSVMLRGRANAVRAQQLALLHLVFPDTFEGIVNYDHKRMISQEHKIWVTERTDDVDRMLAQIRPRLEALYADEVHFYEDGIRKQWDPRARPIPNPNLWDDFVGRAKAFYASGRLDTWEVNYKLDMGRKLAEAREAVLAGQAGWDDLVKSGINNNPVHPMQQVRIRNWMEESSDDVLRALRALWSTEDLSVDERIRDFCDLFPQSVMSGVGTRLNVASVLLMGVNVEQYPPFRVRVFNAAYKETGYLQPERDTDEAEMYEHALGFLDRFMEEARKRGLSMRHRLDAQSYVWGILKHTNDDDDDDSEPDPYSIDPWTSEKVEALAKQLMWPTGELQKIVDGLMDKRQVIFQGPPGTGKTYAAKRIAEWCKEHGGGFKVVQFHPSYSYEDFVEGYRPTLTDGGQAAFKLTEGPLREASPKRLRTTLTRPFILLIDEINRGNVAKVLGELYFLLEYRDEELELQYSHEPFSLPKNLWFIGTMNTTDRSIALVDAALRRRFYFFGFFPDKPPIKGLLDRWLDEHSPEAAWVAGLVDLANRKLEDQHLGIGPSYFMKKSAPLNENRVRFIWEQAVIPYIEEQCFGDEGKLGEFDYDRLKRELDRRGCLHPSAAGSEGSADERNGQPEDGSGVAPA